MQVCADLYSIATADSLPSEETVKLLTAVLYELPDLGNALLIAIGLVHLRLEIHIACLHHSLDELCSIAATASITTYKPSDAHLHAAAVRFYRLLALFDVPAKEATEKEAELHRLWSRIANMLASRTSVLDRTTVLSCLLAQKSQSMCRWFVKLLNAADLRHLISKNVPTSVYSDSTTPVRTVPDSTFIREQTLPDDDTRKDKSEEMVLDDTGFLPSAVDKSEVMRNVSPIVSNDTVHIMALSSTTSRHAAWFHLYMMCFKRKIHFLDLFLVSNVCLILPSVLCF